MMKKLLLSLGLSLAVCLAGAFVNYRSFLSNNYLNWSMKMHGGEITVEYGFGWIAAHIYAMTQESTTTHNLRFSPGLFISLLLIGTLLCFLIISLATHRGRS